MIDYDDFKDDDVIIIEGGSGISISQSKDRFLLFKAENVSGAPPWKIIAELPVNKIRGVEKVDGSVERSLEVNVRVGGGLSAAARGIGEGVGGALRDAVDKRKAKKETGLLFDLDWFDEPAFFVNIPDPKTRNQANVCLRHIFEGRALEGTVREVDYRVPRSFPNLEMRERIAKEKASADLKIKRFYWIASAAFVIVICFFAFVGIDNLIDKRQKDGLWAYRAAVFRDPSMLATAQGDSCILIKRGYHFSVDQGGPLATHVYDSWSAPGNDLFQFSGISDCRYAYVTISANQDSVAIAGENSCGINTSEPPIFTPLVSDDMRFFAPLTEPTC
jgi:hypothetical protein